MPREPIPINWILVENLLQAGCSQVEIASHFQIHPDTLRNNVEAEYGMDWSSFSAKYKQKGESILRATQYAKAIGDSDKGDNTMLVWLGKNRLGQKDKSNEESEIELLKELRAFIKANFAIPGTQESSKSPLEIE